MPAKSNTDKADALYLEFKKFAVKGGRLSAADKRRIKEVCEDLKIQHRFNTSCSNCYTDAIVLVLAHLRKQGVSDAVGKCGYYVAVNGGAFTWRGTVVSNYNLTDEMAERLLATEPTAKFLIKKKEQ